MIDTKLEFLSNDLREVETLFDGGEQFNIRHLFSESENKLVNTIVVNGKSYAYGNLIKPFKDEIERKRIVKRYAKLAVYKALSAFTGKSLPWGALTGIRPTKLAYQTLETSGEFEEFFIDTMKVSERKTSLIKSVLEMQKGVYEKNDDNTAFFVFIPFCPSRCRYCSFISADVKSSAKYIDEYVDTLVYEIENSKDFIRKLRSIYIGGGTPVALTNERLEKVLTAIDKINTGVEYTVEAGRPDAINAENLSMLKAHGVTRICVNPQTFNDKTLEILGRSHTSRETEEKYELAKKFGFDVNMDLIAALPNETFDDFKYSLDKAKSLSPEDITVHTLCIKRGSYLAEMTDRLPEGEVEKMVDYARETLENGGYKPYYLYRQKYMAGNLENVGYAKQGKACVYNIDVMEEIAQNVACGANAISKFIQNGGERVEREASPKDVRTYLEKINAILDAKRKLFS